jgi:hypothetical protein
MRQVGLILLLGVALVGFPSRSAAQGLVTEALSGFPAKTTRVEYSNPAALRQLPNYQSLRQRFVGPRLKKLEDALKSLGVQESDVDEFMLGWEAGKSEADIYGYASGRFDPAAIAAKAAASGVTPTPVAGHSAYCLEAGLAASCAVVLSNSLGAFGSLTSLTSMLEAHDGQAPALSSDTRFTQLVDTVPKGSPIWGVGVGAAVGDWFKGWMPSQGTLKLDWARVFEKVDSLVYDVVTGDQVTLNMKLDCATAEDAASLRQILAGLKMAQELAWQSQNPGKPNPFQAMEVSASGQEISLDITTTYAELEMAGGFGSTQQ